jgi:hypothetical protein
MPPARPRFLTTLAPSVGEVSGHVKNPRFRRSLTRHLSVREKCVFVAVFVLPMRGSGSNTEYAPSFKGDLDDLAHNPWLDAGPISRLFFLYMDSFVRLGHRKPLEQEDLQRMRPQDQVLAVQKRFNVLWQKELEVSSSKGKQPSLFRTLWRLTNKQIMFQACLEVISRGSQLGGPLVLRQLILFVGDPTIDDNRGWYLCVAVMFLALAQGLASAHSIRLCLSGQLNATAAIRTAVFAKSLRVSLASRASKGTGEIINLMSIDSDAVGQVYFFMYMYDLDPRMHGITFTYIYQDCMVLQ